MLAHLGGGEGLVGAGDVLEQLLDQVDVGEDHAAAAVAREAELVEGVTEEGMWLARGVG